MFTRTFSFLLMLVSFVKPFKNMYFSSLTDEQQKRGEEKKAQNLPNLTTGVFKTYLRGHFKHLLSELLTD